nr:MAG TPA: hypothetical protein [Caudoviricetes sp.]
MNKLLIDITSFHSEVPNRKNPFFFLFIFIIYQREPNLIRK